MSKPRVKPQNKKGASQSPPEEEYHLKITNAGKLPDDVKESFMPVKGAIQQMIDRYIDDTLLYLRTGGEGKVTLIKRGESLKRLLDDLKTPSKKINSANEFVNEGRFPISTSDLKDKMNKR